MKIADIQEALKLRGFDPGPIDGAWGRKSIAALKSFQGVRGLTVDGVPGPLTLAALRASAPGQVLKPAPVGRPVWYQEAERLKGLRETPGTGNNATIMGWAKRLGGSVARVFTADSVAWCGLFVANAIATTLPDEPLPENPLGARNWGRWGRELSTPALGAVVVFWRGSRSSGLGHVGFYAGEDGDAVHVLGGNQSDAVTVARLSKSRLVGYRWPTTAPLPTGGRVTQAAAGGLSTNEA